MKRKDLSIICAVLLLLGALALFQLSGCGSDHESSANNGTVTTAITDARAFGSFSSVHVKVVKVVAVPQGSENLSDTDASLPVLATPGNGNGMDINLMNFHFVPQVLGANAPIPAGTYSQIRLILAANQQGNLSNYVVQTGNPTQLALTTPSAQQTGLKINGKFTVTAGQATTLLIDFNPAAAIVVAGNSGQVILKPTGIKLVQINGSSSTTLANVGTVMGTIRSPAFSKWSSATVSVFQRNPGTSNPTSVNAAPVSTTTVFSNLSSSGSGVWKAPFTAFLPANNSTNMTSSNYKLFINGVGSGAANQTTRAFKTYSSPLFVISNGVDTSLPPNGNAVLTP